MKFYRIYPSFDDKNSYERIVFFSFRDYNTYYNELVCEETAEKV